MTNLSLIHPELHALMRHLESARRAAIARLRHQSLTLFAVMAFVAGVLVVYSGSWLPVVPCVLVGIVLNSLFTARHRNSYVAAFKRSLMPELVKLLSDDLRYRPYEALSEEEFVACGLFQAPDNYSGSDLVEGMVGETHIRFSLVLAEEEYEEEYTTTDTDSDGNTTTDTHYYIETADIFRGLLFSADSNKHFAGATYVYAASSSSARGSNLVRLENPEFNRYFTVHSTDQVEARYLLSPGLMERILDLRKRLNCSLQISFRDDRLWVAIPMGLGMFAPSLWQPIDDEMEVLGYYHMLRTIVEIVTDLNLNTRIWSKGGGSLAEERFWA